ncbi:MAG: ligase-associated DNA damage response exonuclease, partial [Acidobacteriota bacterium]
AGHVLGSAQVRLHSPSSGETWVVSGDYKRDPDPTCEPFEVVPCDVFITEATFALPIYRWPSAEAEIEGIYRWWQRNRREGKASVLFSYAFGKAQRVMNGLARHGADGVWLHGAMLALTEIYRRAGLQLPETRAVADAEKGTSFKGELIIAPPSARGSTWMRRFGRPSTAFVSGWMTLRGRRRQRSVDRGFVLSDHADWPGLLRTIGETGARRVLTTHGYADVLARYLREQGLDAEPLETLYSGAGEDGDEGDAGESA